MSLAPMHAGRYGLVMDRKCDDCGQSKPQKGGQPHKRGTLMRWRCAECKLKAQSKKAAKAAKGQA